MSATPLPADLIAPGIAPGIALGLLPGLAVRFAFILSALRGVIAHRFLKPPHNPAVIVPVWTRLNRAAQRFTALMSLLAEGRLPPQSRPRPRATSPHTWPKSPLPARRGWLLIALRHEAAVYRGQLATLLDEPGLAELLATTPRAGRILRPLCHMLALAPPPPLRLPPRPQRPKHPQRPKRPKPAAASPAPTARAAPAPRRVPSPPHGWIIPPVLPAWQRHPAPPICARWRNRWPWVPHPDMIVSKPDFSTP